MLSCCLYSAFIIKVTFLSLPEGLAGPEFFQTFTLPVVASCKMQRDAGPAWWTAPLRAASGDSMTTVLGGGRRALWVHSSARASWPYGLPQVTTIPKVLCAQPGMVICAQHCPGIEFRPHGCGLSEWRTHLLPGHHLRRGASALLAGRAPREDGGARSVWAPVVCLESQLSRTGRRLAGLELPAAGS